MKHLSITVLLLLVLGAVASAQVYPPYGLTADLGLNGEVTLNWSAPSAGLAETFDVDPGSAWNWICDDLQFADGYAKMNGASGWQTGAYEAMEFANFTLTSTFEIQDTQTSSRGIMWCTNGPRDTDFQGYGMYVSNTSYSVWKYTAGSASSVISWTTGTGINTGQGAVNTMEVVASGGTFDLYINGTYHNSFSDASYPQGYVGVIEAYNVTWYDDIYCTMGAMDSFPTAPAAQGVPVDGYYDDMHNPIDAPMPVAEGVRVFDRFGEGHAIDAFLYYKVYRDGVLIATPTDEMYVDYLPSPGEYSYEVTAYYDEGESDPAGPAMVDWVAFTFYLTPYVTTVPEGGGEIMYDATLISTVPNMAYGMRYQTFVTTPGGCEIPRIDNIPFTLVPFMNYTLYDMMLYVPAGAPEGAYELNAMVGCAIDPFYQLWDGFPFAKVGAGLYEDFEDGAAQGFEFYTGDGMYDISDGYCKFDQVSASEWGSGTYMGMGFDNFTASTTFMYEVTNGYSVGMLFRGNGPQDGDYNGYAVYISNTSYSAWVYTAGSPANLIGWTTGTAVNTGVGAVNTLEISANGADVDITINGNYEGSFNDGTYADGYVGMVACYTNETWFDEIGASFGAVDGFNRPVGGGEVEVGYRDHMGVPCAPYDRGVAFDRSSEFVQPDFTINPEEWIGSGREISVDQARVTVPTEFVLENAYPNPFNPTTTLAVTLPSASDLTVNVYNITGQLVATIAEGTYMSGRHTLTFDASNLASGLYFVRATVPGQMDQTQKVMLVR